MRRLDQARPRAAQTGRGAKVRIGVVTAVLLLGGILLWVNLLDGGSGPEPGTVGKVDTPDIPEPSDVPELPGKSEAMLDVGKPDAMDPRETFGAGYAYRPETLNAYGSLIRGPEWSKGSPQRTGPDAGGLLRAYHRKTQLHFNLIPAGSFSMGSDSGEKNETPRHPVRISRAFLLCESECTQAAIERVAGSNPSHFRGNQGNPVEQVSFPDAQLWLEEAGGGLRLPSEAEWEYACRAGGSTAWHSGDRREGLGEVAVYLRNNTGRPRPVMSRLPNAFGLYDMHGNVQEWCEDTWHDSYAGAPADGSAWIRGGTQGKQGFLRVIRGGGWPLSADECRSAARGGLGPDTILRYLGFRPARSLD